MKKRVVSLALALLMLVSTVYVTAFATGEGQIKNIIYLIPDGGGYPLYDFANMVKISGGLSDEKFPYKTYTDATPMTMRTYLAGSMTTSPVTGGVTDSAAAGTAMATGHKTINGYLGVDRAGVPKANLVEAAESKGKSTGLIATYEWVHATPGSFSAHAMNRSEYKNIYEQMENKGIEVVLGAGYGAVSEYATIQNAIDSGYLIVEGWEDLDAVHPGDMLWGNIANPSLPYDIKLNGKQANLEEMTRAAITALSGDPDGFFLMVEGSKVDSGGHLNDALVSTSEYLAFDAAFRVAIEFAKGRTDTVVICAPDHDTGDLNLPENAAPYVEEVRNGVTPTGMTWGTTGHSAQNVGVWAYVPEGVLLPEGLNPVLGDTEKTRTDYVIDNTALAPWCASLMGVNLDELSKELFCDVTSIGTYLPATGKFTFASGDKYVYANQDEYYKNGEKISTNGKVALALNGKFYVPSEMVEDKDWSFVSTAREGITGTGTASDPFIIDDAYDFIEFSANLLSGTTYEGKYFRQDKDIDLTGEDYTGVNESATFAGIYDGNGHKITVNLTTTKNSTLFPYVTGKIMNLGAEGSITSSANYTAGIARSLRAGSIMSNCWSNVSVTAPSACGLAYSNYGTIENCFFGGTLSGTTMYPIAAPHGDVNKTLNCFYIEGTGNKTAEGAYPVSEKDAKETLAEELNQGRKVASGTLGVSEDDLSYWTNEEGFPTHYTPVPVVDKVVITPEGAVVSKGDGAFFTAEVIGKFKPSPDVTWSVEGDVKEGTFIADDGYLTVDKDETAESFKVMAKSNQDGSVTDVATVTVGQFAKTEPDGSRSRPYLITSADDFISLMDEVASGNNKSGLCFKQTKDIDLAGTSFKGIGGSKTFAGIYDGNGYTINIDMASDTDLCLFPYTTGTIMNLGVTGKIKNGTFAAAICRSIRKEGKMINCWSDAYVEGANLGSIAWSNYGIMANCVFTGTAVASGSGYAVTNRIDGSVTSNTYQLGSAYIPDKEISEVTVSQVEKNLASWLNDGISDAAKKANIPKSFLKTWVFKDGKIGFGTPEENNDIILTIDKKEASVFGEIKVNDVAPLITNGRTMLPARFVTEALGGTVLWDGEKREVIIEKEGLKLILTIDKDTAILNG
ncbi:MAG: alkaline phosphatase, partial [Clostridia bacterium]|nr:alkaline phosphatase [Clostridia bacterium]